MAILINGKKVAGVGAPGKSAYQAAVDGGYTGTESEFNALLANGGTKPKYKQITLLASAWADNAQTVTAQGVLADETKQLIQPMPATATTGNQEAYVAAGIMCTAQAADSLTFTCSTVPTVDIIMYITITEVAAG